METKDDEDEYEDEYESENLRFNKLIILYLKKCIKAMIIAVIDESLKKTICLMFDKLNITIYSINYLIQYFLLNFLLNMLDYNASLF